MTDTKRVEPARLTEIRGQVERWMRQAASLKGPGSEMSAAERAAADVLAEYDKVRQALDGLIRGQIDAFQAAKTAEEGAEAPLHIANFLYITKGPEGLRCRGWASLDREARGVAAWMIAQGSDPSLLEIPSALGTKEHYYACKNVIELGGELNRRTGERCPALLVPQLIGLEGAVVEVDYFGQRERFRVGKSMGWLPVHLALRNDGDIDGDDLIAEHVKLVNIIYKLREIKS